MKEALKLVMTLFLVCGIAAGSLALVNAVTKDPIAEHAKAVRIEAQKKVFPDADEYVETQSYDTWAADKLDEKAGAIFQWEAMKGGTEIGTVVQTSVQGYSGIVKIIFGEDREGRITGVSILSNTETAGLGANITTDLFLRQYAGKIVDQIALKKDDPSNGVIDAIAGATISSRAVTKGIREAMRPARIPDGGN